MTWSGRLGAATALAVVLVALELLAPLAFTPLVALALMLGAAINVRAFWRLRSHYKSHPELVSLRDRYYVSMFLAIAAVSLAALGVFVGLRILRLVDALPPQVFLILLAYPCLLLTAPAIDWLRTYGFSDGAG